MRVLTIVFFVASISSFAQEIIKDEEDEFTKKRIKETSFEPIVQNFSMSCFLSVKSIDSTAYLQVIITIGTGAVHSIDRDASFYLKLADESIIELKNLEYALSCRGCAYTGRFAGSQAMGSRTNYILSRDVIKAFSNSGIKKIRIYTSKGYIESDIKEQRANVLQNELALVD